MSGLVLDDVRSEFVDLATTAARHGRPVEELPYAVRILLENLERHRIVGQAGLVTEADVSAVTHWEHSRDRGLPLHVERVILPDSSGLPVLADLAALRDLVSREGGDQSVVESQVPVDLVIDHSLQVDKSASADAASTNLRMEFERNGERYAFLKWAAQSFRSLRVFPPGTGIIHQVHLEHIAEVVCFRQHGSRRFAAPEFVIGADSHTPMINGVGVLGWGVGGIDAEAAMLGMPYVFPCPDIVGVRVEGRIRPGVTTTDAVLAITERLRKEGVVGSILEYFGDGLDRLSVPERATIANMSPENGATASYFPIDARTIEFLAQTRASSGLARRVEAYARRNALFRTDKSPVPHFQRVIAIDLSGIGVSVAGPRRPQDRLDLQDVGVDFSRRLAQPLREGGFGALPAGQEPPSAPSLSHGSIVIAAITSCTNTSNPAVMLAAGLLARKARELGLSTPAHVKTSLAPGSRVVTRYLAQAGLLRELEALGFHVVGYGCTTCGGKSGPLDPAIVEVISKQGLVVAAVLSGNRNFDGRIHRLVKASYIMSPALVVAYALAGRVDLDLSRHEFGRRADATPIMLADLWPSEEEIAALMPLASNPEGFAEIYGTGAAAATEQWLKLAAPRGELFAWDPTSLYLMRPPFFDRAYHSTDEAVDRVENARVLGLFGDALTTDHVSPGGEIPPDSPAGEYLQAQGVAVRDFNTYVGRRCSHEVMARATFANLRIKNLLLPEREGWHTIHYPDGEVVTFHEAAQRYAATRTPIIVLAGREYGTGSSRDWAAKGPALLGVRAIIAESIERIHRANLVGMGILPLAFEPGQGWRQLGLTGTEAFTIDNLQRGVHAGEPIRVTAQLNGRVKSFTTHALVLTESERRQIACGGIMASVARDYVARGHRKRGRLEQPPMAAKD